MAEWPKCSSSYLFVWEAIALAGKAMFGDRWTGGELAALDWPTSPNAAHESLIRAREIVAAHPPRRAATVGLRSPVVLQAVGNEDFSAHVLERHSFLVRSKRQGEWEANQDALKRLRTCADWLHARFREAEVRTYTRMVGTPGEPVELQSSDWFCENAFTTRFVAGRFDRWLPRMSRPVPVYIFVDREGMERAIATLSHADAVVSVTDLSKCSPYLRFAVAFARKWEVELRGWTRDSLWRQVRDDWNQANLNDPMLDTMAKRMSYVISFHNPEAIAAGQLGAAFKKSGGTHSTA